MKPKIKKSDQPKTLENCKARLIAAGMWIAFTGVPLFIRVASAEEISPQIQQQTLDLDTAIQEGREHSPSVQKSKAVADESGWKKSESLGLGFLPRVSANANHYFNEKYEDLDIPLAGTTFSLPNIYPGTSVGLDVTIPVFDGLANVEHLKAASLRQEASEQELSHVEFQLDQDIRLAFFQALSAEQLETVASENVKTLADHLKEAEALKNQGAATNYDVLRVEVQLNEAQSDEADALDNVKISRQKLTQLMGLDQDERKLSGTLPEPDSRLVSDVRNDAINSRGDIKALDLRMEAADKEHTAQSLWFVPKVSVGGEYDWYNNYDNSINNSDLFRSAYNVGVFLQWNIFDGGVSYSRAKEAAAQRVQAEKTTDEAKLSVPFDFDFWKRRYLTNSARYEAKKLDVKRSEESVRLARLEERAGSRTSSEVLDAELDLFRSKAGVITSQMNSTEALIKLENVLGRKI